MNQTGKEMHHQASPAGKINPSFTDPPDDQHPSERAKTAQCPPPPYQEHPDAGHQAPGANPYPLVYVSQLDSTPGGPQEVYTPQPQPGLSAHPGAPGQLRPAVIRITRRVIVTPAPDYLCYSIFTMLFCCLPLGIAAVIFSIHSRNARAAGRRHAALRTSRMALWLNSLALTVGLLIIIIVFIILLRFDGFWEKLNNN